MLLEQIKLGPYENFTYVVATREGGEAAVIDPSFGIERALQFIDGKSLKVRYVLNTHSHPDHIAGNDEVKARTGAKIAAHKLARLGQDVPLDDGDKVQVGDIAITVLSTPGHTPDSVLYIFEGNVASGDTLFVGECGRTDLPGGDCGALYDSLFGKVLKLDDALVLLPGHDYGKTPTSTLGYEKLTNYVLKPRSKAEFVSFMRS